MNKKHWLMVTAVVVVGLIAGYTAQQLRSLGEPNGAAASTVELPFFIDAADAMVVVENVSRADVSDDVDRNAAFFEATVVEQPYEVENLDSAAPTSLMDVDRVLLLEPLDTLGADRLSKIDPTHRTALVLSYQDPAIFPDLPTPWVVELVYDDTAGSFIGNAANEALTDQLALVAERPSLDIIADWAREYDAFAATRESGPLIQAWIDATQTPTLDDIWYSADPAFRGLDPEVTPLEVLENLDEHLVFFEVPAAVAAQEEADRYTIEVRTPLGVAHRAALSAGPHTASLLAKPGDSWEVVITYDDKLDGKTLGIVSDKEVADAEILWLSFDPDELMSAQEDAFKGGSSLSAASAEDALVTSSRSQDELDARLAELVDPDEPINEGPEPPGDLLPKQEP